MPKACPDDGSQARRRGVVLEGRLTTKNVEAAS